MGVFVNWWDTEYRFENIIMFLLKKKHLITKKKNKITKLKQDTDVLDTGFHQLYGHLQH